MQKLLTVAFWLTMWILFPYAMGAIWIAGFVWGVLTTHFRNQNEILEQLREME